MRTNFKLIVSTGSSENGRSGELGTEELRTQNRPRLCPSGSEPVDLDLHGPTRPRCPKNARLLHATWLGLEPRDPEIGMGLGPGLGLG